MSTLRDTHVWLSPQGHPPTLIEKALLLGSLSPILSRLFDPGFKPPPRVLALEKDAADGVAEPVYYINLPPEILAMCVHILLHPQLQYTYSVDKSGTPESLTRITWLRYLSLFTNKRMLEDDGEVEESAAKRRKVEEGFKAFDAACVLLLNHILTQHPKGPAFVGGTELMIHCEFLNTYKNPPKNPDRDITHTIDIDGKPVLIAWYFGTRGDSWLRRCEQTMEKHIGLDSRVNIQRIWERDMPPSAMGSMRKTKYWPALQTASEVDALYHERVHFTIIR